MVKKEIYIPTSIKSEHLCKEAINEAYDKIAVKLANIELLEYHLKKMKPGSEEFIRCKDTIKNLYMQMR